MLGLIGGGITSGVSAGIGGLQTVLGWLTNAFRFVVGQLTSFAGLLLRTGAMLGGVVIGGITAFAAALAASTKAATEHARQIIGLRNATGMSTGMAQGIANRFGAFGIGAGDLSNGGQHHGVTSMAGRVFGVNPYDPASINARAQSFGGGFMGHAMRQSMLSGIGMNSPQGQFLANLPRNRVQEQLGYQSRIQNSLGMSPETVRRFAEDLPLVTARIGMVVDAIKMKFAATLLPIVERTLGRVADYLAKHSGTIGKVIERAGKWLMEDLPPMILKGAISFLNGAGYLLKGFGEFTTGLISQVPAVLTVFDAIINGIRSFVGFIAGAANVVVKAGGRLGIGAGASAGGAASPSPVARVRGAIADSWDMYQDISNPYGGGGMPGLNQSGMWGNAVRIGSRIAARAGQFGRGAAESAGRAGRFAKGAAQVGAVGTVGYAGMSLYGAMEGATGNYAEGRDNALSYLGKSDLANNPELISNIQGILRRIGETSSGGGDRLLKLASTLEAQLEELKKGNHLSEKTEKNTAQTANGIGGFANNTANRVLSYIAEDTGLAVFGQ